MGQLISSDGHEYDTVGKTVRLVYIRNVLFSNVVKCPIVCVNVIYFILMYSYMLSIARQLINNQPQ